MSEWIAIAVRFALYVDLMVLFGLCAFVRLALRKEERGPALGLPLRTLAASLLLLGVAVSGLGLLVLTAQMSGVTLADLDAASIKAVVLDTPAGTAWLARIAALIVAMGLFISNRTNWLGAMILSGIALATLAWSGHAAMDEGLAGWIHLAGDILHLIAAAGWLGALTGFLLLLWVSRKYANPLPLTYRALSGFSSAGTLLVGVIVLTGLVNLWFTVGLPQVSALFTTLYGQLLLAKLASFAVMLLLASVNRSRLTPALARIVESGGPAGPPKALRASIAFEELCGIAVLAAVAWMGTLSPPISGM